MAEKVLEVPNSFIYESGKAIDKNTLAYIIRELKQKLNDTLKEKN